jgi:hypothetical protein
MIAIVLTGVCKSALAVKAFYRQVRRRTRAMQGFDDRFDPPDYIYKITREIWEERHQRCAREILCQDITVRATTGIKSPLTQASLRHAGDASMNFPIGS